MNLEGLIKVAVSVVVFLGSLSVAQAACWERKEYREIEGFSELENKLILSFKDAVTCDAMEGVTVMLGDLEFKTDKRGYVTLSMNGLSKAANLDIPMTVTKEGYTPIKTKLVVAAASVWNKRMLLSPSLAGNSMRFILQWNDEPNDLDLHLEGNGFKVSYRNMRAGGEARLDQDEQKGFGPETITVMNIKQHQHYKLSVVNYSAEAAMDESAKVLVYVGDTLDRVIPLNRSSDKKVEVLEISNGTINQLQVVNNTDQTAALPGW